ncbi:glycosyltransferase [Anoxynatronum buryatiense]|uniref:sucrose-phosphate synthase n=1 Tax=Anoxynatronum buryatiense TaxID=489973 RepID=A0AA45WSN4_9CLOT|nr:glycosyltransferase [Anoxynatronum buryatiense]SMP38458.1 sucrose-phosphate synthase [Anoxynatronum buryatiense]
MHIACFNPQGNFDQHDSYWTQHPDFGGQLVYVKELAFAFDRLGHETIIFTRRIEDEDWPEFQQPEEVYAGTNVRIVRISFGGKAFLPKEQLWPFLHEFVEGIRQWYHQAGYLPDAVTTHYGDGGISGAIFQQLTGVPYTFTAHSLGAQKLEKLMGTGVSYETLDQQYQFTIRLAAERTAISQAMIRFVSTQQEKEQQYFHTLYRDLFSQQKKLPFVVVPPGVNQDIFNDKPQAHDQAVTEIIQQVLRRDVAKERQHLPWVIASSRLDPKKNVTGLVKAYGEHSHLQECCNLILAVRGIDDPQADMHRLKNEEQQQLASILNLIQTYQLAGKIGFVNLSGQQQLAAAYRETARRHGVFALTSLYEPFGLATIEAMACGVPVVVTANGGGQDILKKGNESFGLLVDPQQSDAIAEGIFSLMKDHVLWNTYHQKGLERVRSTFTWNAAADAYVKEIQQWKKNTQEKARQINVPDYFMKHESQNKHEFESIRARAAGIKLEQE